jgi:hypothetical protein
LLTLDQLHETPEFSELTSAEKLFIDTYVSNGFNSTQAVRTAYQCKNDGVAQRMSYRLLGHLRIVMVLARHREELPKETFLGLLRRASLKKGITKDQLAAFRLYAEANGWIKAPRREPKEAEAADTVESSDYDLTEYEPATKPGRIAERK